MVMVSAMEATSRPGRDELEILCRQIRGIEAWHVARRAAEARDAAVDGSRPGREVRLDSARRADVVRRQHQALIDHTHAQLRDSVHLLRKLMSPRVLVVHRDEWFRERVSAALIGAGVTVVARLDNGADGVGVAVAEQPDLILVEDRLPMLCGADVIRQVLAFSPQTLAAAQVRDDWDIGALMDAGACTAVNRRVPPDELAQELCALLG